MDPGIMKFTRRRAFFWPAMMAGTAPHDPGAEAAFQAPDPGKPSASQTPARLVSLRDIERRASSSMPRATWEFINSGAGDEWTVRWNEESFQRLRLQQRVMTDLSRLNTRVRLMGRERPHPILLSPTSNHALVHPDGEIETARGAGEAGAILIVSTFADRPLEEIARAATQPLWHATYLFKDRGRTQDLLRRAEAAGCEAICVPIDSPVVGARDREHRTYRFPREPVSFQNYPVDYWRYPTTWKDVDWIRTQTKLPLVLKGILDPGDAERGIRAGAQAIFVSNHGGRNLDTLPATLDVLPDVADKVAGRVPIVVDGGIRRGTDVLKALALGAAAVAIGRPYLYGLACSGAAGVRGVVNILRNELEMAMAMTGRLTVASIDKSVVHSMPDRPAQS
jgi:4-hydroxymandelate oxidase